ncbi:MAG: MarR family transcriptional regulator [Bacteroidales bacterium]|nr:MarR family transcriptional regulator [Bacteroidales bacterium]
MSRKNNPLSIDNQLCFPLYAAAKEVVKRYTPYLKPLGLTYTQYIVMMVLWEEKEVTSAHLGERLHLDSGTLTPMLKKMEQNGLICRRRSDVDERNLVVAITQQGEELRQKAVKVPAKMAQCVNLSAEEAVVLYQLLYKILD